jgi:hypothetical protein
MRAWQNHEGELRAWLRHHLGNSADSRFLTRCPDAADWVGAASFCRPDRLQGRSCLFVPAASN